MSENVAPMLIESGIRSTGTAVLKSSSWQTRRASSKGTSSNRSALGDISNVHRKPTGKIKAKGLATRSSMVDSKLRMAKKQNQGNPPTRKAAWRSTSGRDQKQQDDALNYQQIRVSMLMDSPQATSDDEFDNQEEDLQTFLTSIDSKDIGDKLTFSEYANDIYEHMRKTETLYQASKNYMARQRDINVRMREILVDWLVEVHLKFRLEPETLFLTINIIDRFLERRAVTRDKLQLVGCAAMLLASKYEEIYAPEVRDFVYISDRAYTKGQILAMETIMLNALQFNLTISSVLKFSDRFIRVVGKQNDQRFNHYVKYLIELTLQQYSFLEFLPSMIAASAVFIALQVLYASSWVNPIARYTQYSPAAMQPCLSALWSLMHQENSKYRAVRKKYSSSKLSAVALINTNSSFCKWFAPPN